MNRQEIEHIIINYLKGFELLKAGIFGSFARNEQTSHSDLDILVKFKNVPSLLQLIKLENELSKMLGCKVDLITEGAVKNKRIKEQIKRELQIIYDV